MKKGSVQAEETLETMIENKSMKLYNGPSKNEIKKILSEYDRTFRVDPKKLLRWPIEIWVSCGEAFIQPKQVIKNETQKIVQRENLDKAEHELEKQTHALRQMAGRRLTGLNTGHFKSVKNPDYPVVKEGHWSEVPYEEKVKKTEVEQLKVKNIKFLANMSLYFFQVGVKYYK